MGALGVSAPRALEGVAVADGLLVGAMVPSDADRVGVGVGGADRAGVGFGAADRVRVGFGAADRVRVGFGAADRVRAGFGAAELAVGVGRTAVP